MGILVATFAEMIKTGGVDLEVKPIKCRTESNATKMVGGENAAVIKAFNVTLAGVSYTRIYATLTFNFIGIDDFVAFIFCAKSSCSKTI